MTVANTRLLAAVAAHRLPGAGVQPLPEEPLPDQRFDQLLAAVSHQRLIGQLADAVTCGLMPVSGAQLERVRELQELAMAQAVSLERRLCALVDLLDAQHVDYRVLKGPVFAHTVYPDPSWRVFGDIDLLVRSDDFADVVGLLTAQGFRRPWPEPRPGFDRRFGKGASLVDADGFELDLHRTFVLGPYGLSVHLDDLFSPPAVFVLAGRRVKALPVEQRFLHACYHAALGNLPPRLVALRDVAQHLLTVPLDQQRVLELATRWDGAAVVARAVQLTWSTFELGDVVALSAWAQRYEPTRSERRALSTYVGRRRNYGAKALASLRVLPGWQERAAFLAALALPRRTYLSEHRTRYWDWWRRGATTLVRRRETAR